MSRCLGFSSTKPAGLVPQRIYRRREEKGWLSAEWGLSETNRRAKYYRLTKAGKAQFEVEVGSWGRVAFAINRSLEATS